MVTIDQQINGSNLNQNMTFTNWIGQSFNNNSSSNKLTSVTLRLDKTGTPTGSLWVGLFNTSGTAGSIVGSQLLATSSKINIASLTTSMAPYTFQFTAGSQIQLNVGSYFIGIMGTAFSSVLVNAGSPSSLYPGNCATSATGSDGTWAFNNTYTPMEDLYFIATGSVVANYNQINIAGSWRNISSEQISIAGSWRTISHMSTSINGSWRSVF